METILKHGHHLVENYETWSETMQQLTGCTPYVVCRKRIMQIAQSIRHIDRRQAQDRRRAQGENHAAAGKCIDPRTQNPAKGQDPRHRAALEEAFHAEYRLIQLGRVQAAQTRATCAMVAQAAKHNVILHLLRILAVCEGCDPLIPHFMDLFDVIESGVYREESQHSVASIRALLGVRGGAADSRGFPLQ